MRGLSPGDQIAPISGLPEPTRAFTLTRLVNYVPYMLTLEAVMDSALFLTETVTVMTTDMILHLPVVSKDP